MMTRHREPDALEDEVNEVDDPSGARRANPRGGTRWRTSTIALAALLAACLVVAGLAWKREHDRATAQERAALAHGLALHAADLRDADPRTAQILGVAAVRIHSDGQTRAGLIDTLVAYRGDELTPDASNEVALSDDGRVALTVDGDEVNVWDLTTWLDPEIVQKSDRIATLRGHGEDVEAVALSSDGRTALTGDGDGTAIVWDLADPARPIRTAAMVDEGDSEYAGVLAVALSRDGRTALISGRAGGVTVWDLKDRSRPVRLSVTGPHASSVEDLGLGADGGIAVTVERRGAVTVWSLAAPSRPARTADLTMSDNRATATAVSADGRVALVGNGHRVEVWNLADRSRPVRTAVFEVPFGDLHDMELASDGKAVLLAGANDFAALWDLSDPFRPTRRAALKGYARAIDSVALSAGGGVALVAGTGGVSLWDLGDLAEVAADPEGAACDGHTADAELGKADWERYTGGADWSDYVMEGRDALLVCLIDPGGG